LKHIFVLDTNVLLEEPNIIYSFPDAEVIVPETVLSEIDKLKTARVSGDLKYHGREVSRMLFELSEKGKLSEGVKAKNGALIKVATLTTSAEIPKSLSLKSTDDRILAITYQIHKKNPGKVTLVTSDLNMLLKAQTFGINIHHKEKKKKKESVFGEIPSEATLEEEIYQAKKNDYLKVLQDNPNDLQALVGLGNLYFDTKQYQLAINTYQRALEIQPNNTNIRTDLGISYFYLGMNDAAIREFQEVLKIDPNHPNAHFNLGIVFWRGKNEPQNALKEFEKYLELCPEGPSAEDAKQNITQIKASIKKNEGGNE